MNSHDFTLNLKPHYTYFNPRKFPSYKQPYIVGYFSLDSNRCYHPTSVNCKYIKCPELERLHLDLNVGYEKVIPKPPESINEKIDHLLHFAVNNIQKLRNNNLENENKLLKADIICFRGLLRLLMTTPYEQREGWSILVTKFQGTVYLCAHETEENRRNRESRSDAVKKILSYGFKFEQYLQRDDPAIEPDVSGPVNEAAEFCCLFESQLDGIKLLFGAEMDGIESDIKLNLDNLNLNDLKFIELKVNRKPTNYRERQNFAKFKLRNWWCQCFLAGISKMIVGERNDLGIVNNIQTFRVNELPKMDMVPWSPSICLEFCSQFLSMVMNEMNDINCANTVYKFDYDPKLDDRIYFSKHIQTNKYSFLPDWYTTSIIK